MDVTEIFKWVLIGMSLPSSDYHLHWLLREAASKWEGRARPKLEVANRIKGDARDGSGYHRPHLDLRGNPINV